MVILISSLLALCHGGWLFQVISIFRVDHYPLCKDALYCCWWLCLFVCGTSIPLSYLHWMRAIAIRCHRLFPPPFLLSLYIKTFKVDACTCTMLLYTTINNDVLKLCIMLLKSVWLKNARAQASPLCNCFFLLQSLVISISLTYKTKQCKYVFTLSHSHNMEYSCFQASSIFSISKFQKQPLRFHMKAVIGDDIAQSRGIVAVTCRLSYPALTQLLQELCFRCALLQCWHLDQ